MPRQDNFTIRSAEVQALISKPPRWIIRWGLSLLFFVALLVILCSIFVKVPEYLTAAGTVEILGKSSPIKAQKNGQIETFFHTGKPVKTGDQLLATTTFDLFAKNDGFLFFREPLYPGKVVQRNDTLMYLANSESKLLVNIKLPEKYYNKVRKGQTVVFENENTVYRGELHAIGNLVEDENYTAVVLLDAKEIAEDQKLLSTILNTSEVKILINKRSLFAGLL